MLPPRRILTGGAGYIGTHVCAALYASGYDPVILDSFSNSAMQVVQGLEQITGAVPTVEQCDLCDTESVKNVLHRHAISGVVHLAALKSVSESVRHPLRYYQNNVVGRSACGPQCRQ